MLETNNLKQSLINKSKEAPLKTLHLALMAGVYISIGAIIYILVTAINANEVSFRFIGAMLFSIGLIMVIFFKAQLFTGNNLMFLNLFQKETKTSKILKNWLFVYFGNFIGSMLLVFVMSLIFAKYEGLSSHIAAIAAKKTSYNFATAYTKAIFCNMLVCIAVTLGVCLKSIPQKIIGIIIPITLFVFLGFEHSIANMFFVPLGLLLGDYTLSAGINLFLVNIIPVTLGNISGGLLVSLLLYKLNK